MLVTYVLSGYDHVDYVSSIVECDLRFAVRPQPRQGTVLSQLRKFQTDVAGQDPFFGHQIRSLVSRITHHDPLVTGAPGVDTASLTLGNGFRLGAHVINDC